MTSFLAELGITAWVPREQLTPKDDSPRPQVICVAEQAYADIPLLHNILKAIECSPEQALIRWVNDPAELLSFTWDAVPVICFGENLRSYVPEQAIKTLRLTELSQNIQAKKALWADLKKR